MSIKSMLDIVLFILVEPANLSKLGSFLSGSAIAIIALSNVVGRIDLRRSKQRLRYLQILENISNPVEVTDNSGSKTVEINPIADLNDIFVLNLLENISKEDKIALSTPPSSWPKPYLAMERQKYAIYKNKKIIPNLIKNAQREFSNLRKFYILVELVFISGLLLQLYSIIYRWN